MPHENLKTFQSESKKIEDAITKIKLAEDKDRLNKIIERYEAWIALCQFINVKIRKIESANARIEGVEIVYKNNTILDINSQDFKKTIENESKVFKESCNELVQIKQRIIMAESALATIVDLKDSKNDDLTPIDVNTLAQEQNLSSYDSTQSVNSNMILQCLSYLYQGICLLISGLQSRISYAKATKSDSSNIRKLIDGLIRVNNATTNQDGKGAGIECLSQLRERQIYYNSLKTNELRVDRSALKESILSAKNKLLKDIETHIEKIENEMNDPACGCFSFLSNMIQHEKRQHKLDGLRALKNLFMKSKDNKRCPNEAQINEQVIENINIAKEGGPRYRGNLFRAFWKSETEVIFNKAKQLARYMHDSVLNDDERDDIYSKFDQALIIPTTEDSKNEASVELTAMGRLSTTGDNSGLHHSSSSGAGSSYYGRGIPGSEVDNSTAYGNGATKLFSSPGQSLRSNSKPQ